MNWNFDLEEALARCRYLGGPADPTGPFDASAGGAGPLRRMPCPRPSRRLPDPGGEVLLPGRHRPTVPSLRLAGAAHRLELCGGPNCSKAGLTQFVEKAYDVRPGGVSTRGNFSYHISGCQRSCRNGPCASWDGTQHTGRHPRAHSRLGRRQTMKTCSPRCRQENAMNDHPCTRAFDHQGGTTVPWIIGASIASVTTVSLATFFWSRQAGFWLLALLAASYLPTPVTGPPSEAARNLLLPLVWFGSPGLCSLLRPWLLVAFPFPPCMGPPWLPSISIPPAPGNIPSAYPGRQG